ncbi:hypothetical protein [Lactobacillus delbrueckii]|uniref:hypothetical protein n=1 Tax=Lactobacillus delbrueckii TaxID=1584 RepID=UPI003A8C893A
MNGKNVGKLSASGDYYQKKLDPVIAGRYTFSVSSIKKLHDNWDDSESVANYNEVVSVPSTGPAGSGKTYVNYTVTHNLSYTGDKDDTSVTDTCQNEIISQDSDGDYVLEKLGTPNAK